MLLFHQSLSSVITHYITLYVSSSVNSVPGLMFIVIFVSTLNKAFIHYYSL